MLAAEAELLEEEAELNQGGGETGKSGLRRRRRTYSRTLPEHLKSGNPYGQEANQHRDGNIGTGYDTPYMSCGDPCGGPREDFRSSFIDVPLC